MRTLARYFLQGCVVLVPSVLTLYVVYLAVRRVDALIRTPVPGMGLVLTLAIIVAVGAFASNVIGRVVVRRIERMFGRVPLVRLLYTTVRDLIGAFFGEERSFDRPVLVSLGADGGTKALGFITREHLSDIGLSDHVMVYFPQSYNFAGNALVFSRDRVTPLDADAGHVMALVVSGGVVTGRPAGGSVRPPA